MAPRPSTGSVRTDAEPALGSEVEDGAELVGGKFHRWCGVALVMWRVVVVVGLLAGATWFGLWWRSRSGRVTGAVPTAASRAKVAPAASRLPNPERLGFDPAGAEITLVQFSTAFCQPCRATRVILRDVAAALPGVRHVEVDADSHLDIVRELDIRRTPTVLFVDSRGAVVGRASGQPRRADVLAALAPYLTTAP